MDAQKPMMDLKARSKDQPSTIETLYPNLDECQTINPVLRKMKENADLSDEDVTAAMIHIASCQHPDQHNI